MKKIAFVIERLFGGGAERVTAVLMNELCNDAEIHLVSTYDHNEADEYPTDARIIKHTIGKPPKNWILLIFQRVMFLRRVLKELDPSCVVSLATARTNILLKLALLGRKTPVILSERNDPKRNPTSKVIRLLRRWIYATCDGLVFQTREAQGFFPTSISKKSVVISNPITGTLPERYDGPRDRRMINCCRLVPQKNLDLLIDAFSDIADEFPDLSLVIWGEGEERARLEQKICDMNMGERIQLPGHSHDIYPEMWKAQLFVSSSDYEGISNSMLEAVALGVPTICTDCPAGGAREVIRNGENGFLVPVGDREAMANAMRRVLSDQKLADQFSRNGCKLRDDIAPHVIAGKWRDYIDQTVG